MRVVKTGTLGLALLAAALLVVRASAATEETLAHQVVGADSRTDAGEDTGELQDRENDPRDEHGEGDAGLNPLTSWRADTAIWTGVVFVLLLFVLGKFAWGPIADGLDKRELRIADEIQAAENANADAKALLDEYQQKLATAGEEVRQMIEQAKRDAEATGQTIVQKARDEAEAEKRRAVEDIELATAGALKDLAAQSANLAVDLAGKIVQQRLSAADHSALINDAVAKFTKLEPGKN